MADGVEAGGVGERLKKCSFLRRKTQRVGSTGGRSFMLKG
jgi:hypothetical protein